MKPKFIKAFKEVLREQIIKKNDVQIEGLGRFRVVHQEQRQKKYDNGRVVMLPPSDVVEFQSQITRADEDQ